MAYNAVQLVLGVMTAVAVGFLLALGFDRRQFSTVFPIIVATGIIALLIPVTYDYRDMFDKVYWINPEWAVNDVMGRQFAALLLATAAQCIWVALAESGWALIFWIFRRHLFPIAPNDGDRSREHRIS